MMRIENFIIFRFQRRRKVFENNLRASFQIVVDIMYAKLAELPIDFNLIHFRGRNDLF